jgi:phenylpropionate dioxygenase-like ring-hydroxylating dioxygenase large terminal subunit
MTDVGKYVVVYRRQGGTWRAVADIFNSDQPAGG